MNLLDFFAVSFIMMLVSRIQGTARVVLCRFRCAIEQIAVSANENLSVNNDISVSLSITFYEKQIEK